MFVITIKTFIDNFVLPHWYYILAVTVLLWFLSNRYFTPLRTIPGPILASFTRLPRLISVAWGSPHERDIRLHEKYGPLVRMGPDLVGDPQEINKIYGTSTNFKKVR